MTAAIDRSCAGCKHALTYVGIRDLRTGGHGGIATALLGSLAEAGESVLTIALYACTACGRLAMFLPPESR